MDLNNKLKGFPTVYYTNLDSRTDRREYMETQFDRWGITDYHRVSSSKYLSTEEYKWAHLILDDEDSVRIGSAGIANSITHIEILKNWLETTNDECVILMEDDYDLSLIEYWNFDWEYVMNTIPETTDCLLLGYENRHQISFHLQPHQHSHPFGPCMITRDLAKKILKLHYFDGKFKLSLRTCCPPIQKDYGLCDGFIPHAGKTYTLPLITTNPDFGSDYDLNNLARPWFQACREAYYDWWQNEHHKYTLEDFFTYGKSIDYLMTKKIGYEQKKLYQ